jgi:hypothetical protein
MNSLDGFSDGDVRKIMRDNLLTLTPGAKL